MFIVLFWAGMNQFETLEEGFIPPKTKTFRYTNSQDNNEAWFYKIAGWGNGWSRTSDDTGIDTAEVIWEFFSRY
mgnify:FL=1